MDTCSTSCIAFRILLDLRFIAQMRNINSYQELINGKFSNKLSQTLKGRSKNSFLSLRFHCHLAEIRISLLTAACDY